MRYTLLYFFWLCNSLRSQWFLGTRQIILGIVHVGNTVLERLGTGMVTGGKTTNVELGSSRIDALKGLARLLCQTIQDFRLGCILDHGKYGRPTRFSCLTQMKESASFIGFGRILLSRLCCRLK